jgi:pimeloyl-ACP methyl ester carboxylesterase
MLDAALVAISIAVTPAIALAQAVPAATSIDVVPVGFESGYRTIDGIRMHYVVGGKGPLIYLVHGFGETWYKWHDLMPQLATNFTVVAVDLPGLGESQGSKTGYAAQNISIYLYDLIRTFHPNGKFDVIAHDIGVWNTYPMIVEHRSEIGQVIFLEAPIPDTSLYDYPAFAPTGESLVWHFSFFAANDALAEHLISGHERLFFEHFFKVHTGSTRKLAPSMVDEYADAIAAPGRLHASMAYYQDLNKTIQGNEPLEAIKPKMPVLAIGGGDSFGWGEVKQISQYFTNVSGASISGCGHWLPEECPEPTTRVMLKFLQSNSIKGQI